MESIKFPIPLRLNDRVVQIDPKENAVIRTFASWTLAARYAKKHLLPDNDTRTEIYVARMLKSKRDCLGYIWCHESALRTDEKRLPVPAHAQPGRFELDYSNYGRLRRRWTGRLMCMYERSGTFYPSDPAKSRLKNIRVAAVHGPKPPGSVLLHIDGDRRNTRPDNLVWDPPVPTPVLVPTPSQTIDPAQEDRVGVQCFDQSPVVLVENPKTDDPSSSNTDPQNQPIQMDTVDFETYMDHCRDIVRGAMTRQPTSDTVDTVEPPTDLRTFIATQRQRIEGESHHRQLLAVREALSKLQPGKSSKEPHKISLDLVLDDNVLKDLKMNGLDVQQVLGPDHDGMYLYHLKFV